MKTLALFVAFAAGSATVHAQAYVDFRNRVITSSTPLVAPPLFTTAVRYREAPPIQHRSGLRPFNKEFSRRLSCPLTLGLMGTFLAAAWRMRRR